MFGIKKPHQIVRIGEKEIDRQQLKKLSKDEIIDFFLAIIASQAKQIQELQQEVKELKDKLAKLSRNSSTSSKPPSSDITQPRKPKNAATENNKPGAQKGHEGACRCPFPAEQVDKVEKLEMRVCPDCNRQVQPCRDVEPKIQQTLELAAKPVVVIEYQQQAYWCAACGKTHYAPLPEGVVPDQLLDIKLQNVIGYMKGAMHCSYSSLANFFGEVLAVPVSRGLLENTVRRVSEALAQPYAELAEHIKGEAALYIDESGWKENGRRCWAWVFANKLLSFFTIEKSRGSAVLKKVLGESFLGAVISDFFSAYVKFANQIQQFCLAHLIRDIKFLMMLPAAAENQFGKRLLIKFKTLFWLWHKREQIPKDRWEKLMQRVMAGIKAIVAVPLLPPHTQRLAKRLHKHWDAIFCFVFWPAIEPTNNIAERAIRALVMDRTVTQGSRSEWGRQWSARIWTVLSTCRKQNRSAWCFINDALQAHYFNAVYPSLIPVTAS